VFSGVRIYIRVCVPVCAWLMTSRVLPIMLSSPSLSSRLRNLWLPGAGSTQLEAAERRVLSRVHVPFLQRFVPIGDGQYINTLHIAPHTTLHSRQQRSGELNRTNTTVDSGHGSGSGTGEILSVLPPSSSDPPLVLLHGFGAGIGLWYGNLAALSSIPPADTATATATATSSSSTDVYALDLLGCGRSSRPDFTARTTEQAESFFVDSLDRWRAANGIDRMCLAGHSFGGYMAGVYAMRYPHRVSRLILLSPVGVPQQPADYQQRLSHMSTPQRALFGLVNTLWQRGVTPNQFIKAAGPYGRGLIDRYVTRRFPDSPVNVLSDVMAEEVSVGMDVDMAAATPGMDKPAVSDYLYQMIVAPSSGDRALSLILKPGAFAHQPLIDRMPAALVPSSSTALGHSIPTVFCYGASDWMDEKAGANTAAAITARGGVACTIRVRGAGHQLMIDNPAGFKECVEAAMSFPNAEAGTAQRQQWIQSANTTYKQLIIDT